MKPLICSHRFQLFNMILVATSLAFFSLIQVTSSFSNSSLQLQESSIVGGYEIPYLKSPYLNEFDHFASDRLVLENVPSVHVNHGNNKFKITEYSYVKPNFEDDLHLIKPTRISIPVAREILFSEDGKYVPVDRDTRHITKEYLKRNVYLNDCHQNVVHRKSRMLTIDLREAFRYANSALKWYLNAVRKDKSTPNKRLQSMVIQGKFMEFSSQFILTKKCINKYDAVTKLPTIDVRKFLVTRFRDSSCSKIVLIDCNAKSKFRTIDGSCNNLANPTWGRVNTCHRRLLQPDYGDGIEVPRVAHDASDLPNARLISTYLLPHIPISDNKLTSMTMAWGQFIVHDIARTLNFAPDVECCPPNKAQHPECLPIFPLPVNDILTKLFNQTCLNFVRSTICNSCGLGPRQQLNQATHVFDLSHLYGPTLNDTLALRRFSQGKLKSAFDPNHQPILQPARDQNGCNIAPEPPKFRCFQSGDGLRASQHPALQAMHITFHRRHNQHAVGLSMVNPHWNDEKLFQEARRITIAEAAKITYGEYLPAIMGKSLVNHFGLSLMKGRYTHYDPSVDPSTIQEYIVAAGRFGHSQINDVFRVLLGPENSYSFLLRDAFFETSSVSMGHTTGILKGLIQDPTSSIDPFFVPDIKNYLYKVRKENVGRDLPAFNIMRGREHGVPGYVNYLDFCFGFKVKSWRDLLTFIPKAQLDKIKELYKHWKDIDLFVGGISERKFDKAAFGPTFACINGIQFHHLKYGDRFYFEHGNEAGSFTPEQLENIRQSTSLANVLCRTTDIRHSQPNVFLLPSSHNAKVPCEMFEDINYHLWSEHSYH